MFIQKSILFKRWSSLMKPPSQDLIMKIGMKSSNKYFIRVENQIVNIHTKTFVDIISYMVKIYLYEDLAFTIDFIK